MKHRSAYLFAGLLLVFAFGLGRVFQLRLNSGDIFPAYSTQRSDDVGLAALYRALNQLPQLQVSRSLRPLPELETTRSQTVILAGMSPLQSESMPHEDTEWLAQAARGGARVVIAFAASDFSTTAAEKTGAQKKKKTDDSDEKKAEEKKTKAVASEPEFLSLEKTLGVKVKSRTIFDHSAPEAATSADVLKMPQAAEWHNEVYFETEKHSPWKTIFTRGGSPVLIERALGRGSVVLAGNSYFLSNESLFRHEASELIAWLLGSSRQIVFDESHLGLQEQVSIAALARRYGLGGAMLLLLALSGLFIWRRTAVFVPEIPQENHSILEIDHTAGLEALLRRSVPAGELIDTCLSEFKPTTSSDRARVLGAIANADSYPVKKYNAAVHALRTKK